MTERRARTPLQRLEERTKAGAVLADRPVLAVDDDRGLGAELREVAAELIADLFAPSTPALPSRRLTTHPSRSPPTGPRRGPPTSTAGSSGAGGAPRLGRGERAARDVRLTAGSTAAQEQGVDRGQTWGLVSGRDTTGHEGGSAGRRKRTRLWCAEARCSSERREQAAGHVGDGLLRQLHVTTLPDTPRGIHAVVSDWPAPSGGWRDQPDRRGSICRRTRRSTRCPVRRRVLAVTVSDAGAACPSP